MTSWKEARWATRELFAKEERFDVWHKAGKEWNSLEVPTPELVLESLLKKYPEKKIFVNVKNVHPDPYADI